MTPQPGSAGALTARELKLLTLLVDARTTIAWLVADACRTDRVEARDADA